MKKNFELVQVGPEDVEKLGFFCVKNKKHPGYAPKMDWLKKRMAEGLRIKLAIAGDGKQAGFLEYIPGEYTWWVVMAPKYLVIHCLWVDSKKFRISGMASALIKDCIKDARTTGRRGVAVVTSDGTWMSGRDVYLKNGFKPVGQAPPHYHLLAKTIGRAPLPAFPGDWDQRLSRTRVLTLFYTYQCPYIGKALAELPPVAEKHGVKLRLVQISDPRKAREIMPSPYGVFGLVYRGRLLADHAISATRFRNILRNDVMS